MNNVAVFLFHRDLRLYDNTGLNAIARAGLRILPTFIFPPEQIDPKMNTYFSNNAVQFMVESLTSLNASLKELEACLTCFKGDNIKTLTSLHKRVQFKELHCSDDCTPFSAARDKSISEWCDKSGVKFVQHQDVDILDINEGLLKSGKAYQKFTPFYREVLKKNIRKVDCFALQPQHFAKVVASDRLKIEDMNRFYTKNPLIAVHGGRENGVALLRNIQKKTFGNYGKTREIPSNGSGTTMLSAYIKFGVVSIREVYWRIVDTLGLKSDLLKEVIWRSFYAHIAAHYPVFDGAFKPEFARIAWRDDPEAFKRWLEGSTGVPLVDASMRCLSQTGHLNGRLRMVVASFLSKNLLINWRLGERVGFANQLVDYDPASNNGGWAFVSSVGVNSQPYFRVFNPYLQSKKYDPKALFIKKWVPELASIPAKDIHDWEDKCKVHRTDYPCPIVNARESADRAIKIYKKALSK